MQVHWAPDPQTGVAFVDTVVATGPDFVIVATPDPTGEYETSYGVEFSGLDAVICANYVTVHNAAERSQLAAMWPAKIGDTFSRNLSGPDTSYTIEVVRRDTLQIGGNDENVVVLNLSSDNEDHDVYVSERLKTNVRVDWSAIAGVPGSLPMTDSVEKITVGTNAETIKPVDGYEVLASLNYQTLGDCASLLP